MERPERREVGGRVPLGRSNGPEEREQAGDPPEQDPASGAPDQEEGSAGEDAGRNGAGGGEEVADPDELRRLLEAKDWHVRELYDELVAVRLAADEAVAKAEAGELRVGDLEEDRARLREKLRVFQEEERGRRRRREGQDRRVARLERDIERRDAEIQRLQDLLQRKDDEMDAYDQEARDTASRKDVALEDALRRVEGLQRDLEERENEADELRETVDELRAALDLEYERRRRAAEPANRLRAGIDLFNESEHLQRIDSISRSMGRPEVHVALSEEGDEPPVILTFTWDATTWRTYAANPGLAVEEPRVYQMGAGRESSSAGREPPNARISPDGRVLLGL